MKGIAKLGSMALCAASLFTTGSPQADGWPGSVTGIWNIVGNQSSGTLNINFQGGSGQCRPIRGTIYGNNRIEGYYCPGSGRLAFIRYIAFTDRDAVQWWSGNVSQAGGTLRIGGYLAAYRHDGASGSLGEYSFYGTRQ